MLVIAWVLGVAASGAKLDGINKEVRNSAVLGAVDEAMPGGSDRRLAAFDAMVGSGELHHRRLRSHPSAASGMFPGSLKRSEPERIVSVPPPSSRLAHTPGVTRA